MIETIQGGYEVVVRGGVLHLNTAQGSILRISGLPRDWNFNNLDARGQVTTYKVGT